MNTNLIDINIDDNDDSTTCDEIDRDYDDMTDTLHDQITEHEYDLSNDYILDMIDEETTIAIRGSPSDDQLFHLLYVDDITKADRVLEDHYGVAIALEEAQLVGRLYDIERSRRSTGYIKYKISNNTVIMSRDHIICPSVLLSSKGLLLSDYNDICCNVW